VVVFDCPAEDWRSAPSPVYGERGITIQFLCRDLLWRPLRRVVRLVLVEHPTRGRSIFIATDIAMPPIEVIRVYGLRLKMSCPSSRPYTCWACMPIICG